jgi:hypothetical protein
MKSLLPATALLGLSLAAHGADPVPAPPRTPEPLVQGDRSEIHTLLVQRVRGQRDWLALWNAMGLRATRASAAPQVDFSSEQLLAFFAGDQRSGGVAVSIEGIEARDDRLSLTVRLQLPGAGCVVTTAMSQPYQIVRIDRALPERPIDFRYVIERHACNAASGRPAATTER